MILEPDRDRDRPAVLYGVRHCLPLQTAAAWRQLVWASMESRAANPDRIDVLTAAEAEMARHRRLVELEIVIDELSARAAELGPGRRQSAA